MKDNLISISGMVITGGASIYTLIENLKSILGFIGVLITIAIGVTVLIINLKKIQKLSREKKVDDSILKK